LICFFILSLPGIQLSHPMVEVINLILFLWHRNNLQQLDEITTGLRRRLRAEERAQDSESAVPLSTSSALMTVGTTLPSGTWQLSSTLHSSDHVTSDTMASTEGSATAGDAVTELMRRTLESTGSHSSCIRDLSHTVPDEHYHASGEDDIVDMGNLLIDDSANCSVNTQFHGDKRNFEWNSETRASADVDRYTDSLKSAQVLLKQLNEMTASSSLPVAIASSHEVDSASDADFDEDAIQDDDTLASIWALRQSARHDDGDNESLDSAVLPNEHEESYVAPQALNDVASNNDDLSASSHAAVDSGGRGDAENVIELESGRKQQQPAVGAGSGESGDTWFIDTQDLRAVDNVVAWEIHRRIHEDADVEQLDKEEVAKVVQDATLEIHTPGRPLLQSSPSSPVEFSPASGTTRKTRSLRKTVIQRRDQMYTSDSSDSESDAAANMRPRHRRPENSQHAPHDHPSASNADSQAPVNSVSYTVVDDQVKNVVGLNHKTPVAENQESEDDVADEDEPQSTSTDVVSAQSANQCLPSRNDGITISDDEALNGHHSESAEEDSYPS